MNLENENRFIVMYIALVYQTFCTVNLAHICSHPIIIITDTAVQISLFTLPPYDARNNTSLACYIIRHANIKLHNDTSAKSLSDIHKSILWYKSYSMTIICCFDIHVCCPIKGMALLNQYTREKQKDIFLNTHVVHVVKIEYLYYNYYYCYL
jgi:hypothetical protein